MQIKVFTTGGSLDKGYSTRDSDFIVQGPQIGNILGEANVDFDFDIEALLRKDSLDLTEEDRDLIAERVAEDPCGRILISTWVLPSRLSSEGGRGVFARGGTNLVLFASPCEADQRELANKGGFGAVPPCGSAAQSQFLREPRDLFSVLKPANGMT